MTGDQISGVLDLLGGRVAQDVGVDPSGHVRCGVPKDHVDDVERDTPASSSEQALWRGSCSRICGRQHAVTELGADAVGAQWIAVRGGEHQVVVAIRPSTFARLFGALPVEGGLLARRASRLDDDPSACRGVPRNEIHTSHIR